MPSFSIPRPSTAGSRSGSSAHSVELGKRTSICSTDPKYVRTNSKSRHSAKDGLDSQSPRSEQSLGGMNFGDGVEPGTLIDLDELENFDDLWNDEEDLQILRVEERSVAQLQPSKIAAPQRNSPIVAPLVRIPGWIHKNLSLRPSETVELIDGDFILITDIVQDSTWGEVRIRGQWLQRCKSMNGLLERKLNEVCFCQEVDLDDPRPAQEQSAIEVAVELVEVPVDRILRLRSLRKTNQTFPFGRNLDLQTFSNPVEADRGGGLTARWKYTCTYATAADRWHNNPKERTLAFLRKDECTMGFGVSHAARRLDWRGETIPGGAYQPELDQERRLTSGGRNASVVSLASSTSEPESDCIIVGSPTASFDGTSSGKRQAHLTSFSLTSSEKRRTSFPLEDDSRTSLKRLRLENRDEVEIEIARKDLSTVTVEEQEALATRASVVNMTGPPSSSRSWRRSEVERTIASSNSQHFFVPKIQPLINLSSSDLATPALEGTMRSCSIPANVPVIRLPGQMLTYGDAFCGAGGASRGAAMAGLRVLWGFDHWNHACATWRTNFPQAKCYELSSQQFVGRSQGSKSLKPVGMKVDILHLSPPCQYFSPAHTVDCLSDEMNVASLYAVGPVIKVAKPRVVTLEQTFGIVAARFRKYFNSLIQMFTALSFSVRWAIVPLAQWVSLSLNLFR